MPWQRAGGDRATKEVVGVINSLQLARESVARSRRRQLGYTHRNLDFGLWMAFQSQLLEGSPAITALPDTEKVQEMSKENLRLSQRG